MNIRPIVRKCAIRDRFRTCFRRFGSANQDCAEIEFPIVLSTLHRVASRAQRGGWNFLSVTFYDFADINRAIDDSRRGRAVKPVLRIGQGRAARWQLP